MVSYADFMTLLFATFVVLYALSQVDVNSYSKLEESIRQAFKSLAVTEGNDGLMDNNSDKIIGSYDTNSLIMMEYLSPKYEESSYEDIKKQIEDKAKDDANFKNITAEIDDRGLVIKFNDAALMFQSGSAKLTPQATKYLDIVGKMIWDKFKIHLMRVEGHTDNQPMHSLLYPSNWELSSARSSAIIRHFIYKFDFNPVLFSAVGLADTRPEGDNKTDQGRVMNRRVEIIVLRNKNRKNETGKNDVITQNVLEIEHLKAQQQPRVSAPAANVQTPDTPDKPDENTQDVTAPPSSDIIDIIPKPEVIDLDNTYHEESKRIEKQQSTNKKMF